MSRIVRWATLVTAMLSLLAVTPSTASAVTWHNSGVTTFTATTGPFTLSSTSAGLACPSGTMTGTVAASPFVGPVWKAVHGTQAATGCTLGVSGYSLHCTYDDTVTQTISGPPHIVTGDRHVTCDVSLASVNFCHVQGSYHFMYVVPSPPPPSAPEQVLAFTGGNLTVTNGAIGSCPLGNGDTPHLSTHTYTVTSNGGRGPSLTRTA